MPRTTTAPDRDHVEGRILEALDPAPGGGRAYRIRIIAYGDSRNGRRYPEALLRQAAGLYEGARVFDGHRTDDELRSSATRGLLGYVDQVTAEADGLHGRLNLLPSAQRAAEALDATLTGQDAGRPALVGFSHDVLAHFEPIVESGRRILGATRIVAVNSADLVCDPAAGGAVRAVAGGVDPDDPDDDPLLIHDGRTARGRAVVVAECAARGLPTEAAKAIGDALPHRFSEAQLTHLIDVAWSARADAERVTLTPTVPTVHVTQEARDRKIAALDAMLMTGPDRPSVAYRSLRHAWADITGARVDFLGEDENRRILRDTMGGSGYDSGLRSTESLTATSWDQIFGDSITRRMIAEYGSANLQSWKLVVSSVSYGVDFRTQRRERVGGYGVLPTVGQGQPYQPLTSPTDEEATYAITKRGGTEDLTLEMVANDDLQAIRNIPVKLGRAAAITLYRFIWDIFPTNAATTYDSTALFHANHGNTDNPALLGQSTLSNGRRKMRQQAAYGDATDVLSTVPRYIVVPSSLEEIAFQLCTSAVAIPATPAGPSDTPNLHQGLEPIVIDYYSDQNDWYLVADPRMCPTIEIGFYASSDAPELFTQADPTNGSMFNNDTVIWKVRHIYSGTALDHRGFYRGAN
ncbi:hypothetical protein AB0M95_01980 [Sphaerisporangium sp. NPDC051017]|uniref:phage major capsid protein n=1 Tax=Sphaerisporangium sp. NPDC051017 TaxID=3154636 RepID=UPI0034425D55